MSDIEKDLTDVRKYITIEEASKRLMLSEATIRYYVRIGVLEGLRIGRYVRIFEDSVIKVMKEGTQGKKPGLTREKRLEMLAEEKAQREALIKRKTSINGEPIPPIETFTSDDEVTKVVKSYNALTDEQKASFKKKIKKGDSIMVLYYVVFSNDSFDEKKGIVNASTLKQMKKAGVEFLQEPKRAYKTYNNAPEGYQEYIVDGEPLISCDYFSKDEF